MKKPSVLLLKDDLFSTCSSDQFPKRRCWNSIPVYWNHYCLPVSRCIHIFGVALCQICWSCTTDHNILINYKYDANATLHYCYLLSCSFKLSHNSKDNFPLKCWSIRIFISISQIFTTIQKQYVRITNYLHKDVGRWEHIIWFVVCRIVAQ